MDPQEMLERIDKETGPDKMSKSAAYDWLIDLKSLIDGRLEALDIEISEEEEEDA